MAAAVAPQSRKLFAGALGAAAVVCTSNFSGEPAKAAPSVPLPEATAVTGTGEPKTPGVVPQLLAAE